MAFWYLEVVLTSMYFLIKPNTACSTVSELSVVSLYNNREWFQHIEYDTRLERIPVRSTSEEYVLISHVICTIFHTKCLYFCAQINNFMWGTNYVVLCLSMFLRHELFCLMHFLFSPEWVLDSPMYPYQNSKARDFM